MTHRTHALDFAMLPPEVNSARMYSGAGSGPMLVAASAWNGLAAELRATALSYGRMLSALTSDEWHGPASAAMAAAAMPYVAWMNTTAAQAEHTAAQAGAAAAAYETAFAATVPPPDIAANRMRLASLIATNIVGQNTPAIAATEAQYAEMWAQDAAAMYGYAGSSATASRLTPFTPPEEIANAAGAATQAAAVTQAAATSAGTGQSTLSQLISAMPKALQGLASPAASRTGLGGFDIFGPGTGSSSAGASGLLNLISGSNNSAFGDFLNANIWNTIFSSGFYMPGNFMGTAADFMGMAGPGAQSGAEGAAGAAQGAAGAAQGAAGAALGGLGPLGNPVSAGLGQGALVGPLSVPPSWTGAVPQSPLSSTLGGTPMVAPPAVAAGMPGVPMGGLGAQGLGRNVPQYGFRPTFVARPPAAG